MKFLIVAVLLVGCGSESKDSKKVALIASEQVESVGGIKGTTTVTNVDGTKTVTSNNTIVQTYSAEGVLLDTRSVKDAPYTAPK